ncbi:MAG: DUF1295 domain-containing protein [Symploca sp. SIO2G7]|nr:DUF1295 domain-containing protein [Symploca sp. SIO2G7]
MKKTLMLTPLIAGWVMLLVSEPFRSAALVNGILQLLLFLFVVCIPAWRTERMSYVDIAWPWGLVIVGLVAFVFGMATSDPTRLLLVCGLYVLIGGRMGVFALKLWRSGVLDNELPRYRYQARRWAKTGERNIPLARQVELLAQGLANASFLAYPAFLVVSNAQRPLSMLEMIGFSIALAAFGLESLADYQKAAFAERAKAEGQTNAVCDIGLWRYSRHPNYFFEWMVWNGLILMALSALPGIFQTHSILLALFITLGLLFVSRIMYVTLVHYTGAKPAEFYSVQKRPAYVDYQKTTNRFFPGPRKEDG